MNIKGEKKCLLFGKCELGGTGEEKKLKKHHTVQNFLSPK